MPAGRRDRAAPGRRSCAAGWRTRSTPPCRACVADADGRREVVAEHREPWSVDDIGRRRACPRQPAGLGPTGEHRGVRMDQRREVVDVAAIAGCGQAHGVGRRGARERDEIAERGAVPLRRQVAAPDDRRRTAGLADRQVVGRQRPPDTDRRHLDRGRLRPQPPQEPERRGPQRASRISEVSLDRGPPGRRRTRRAHPAARPTTRAGRPRTCRRRARRHRWR